MAKEFKFYGKMLTEIEKMDLKEFAKLLPARQRRSLLKGFTDEQKKLLAKIKKAKEGKYKKQIRTQCRDMIIIPIMLDLLIQVHNGKSFINVKIIPEMLGHYLGEFVLTRQRVVHSAPGIGATRSSASVSVK